jgi:two-component system, chemotaxis family, protein-glutamate methylesterase/glutaminase
VTAPRDIIAIGGSAGAVESLIALVGLLPPQPNAALFVVVHTLPIGESLLPAILGRRGPLKVGIPQDGEPIQCDRIYVAPPDYHLLIEPGHVRLSNGPKEGGHRPAIDPLFRSAALAYGRRVVAVILSGTLDDGSTGLRIVRRHGGTAIVQDPEEALFPQMPRNAILRARPQHVARVEQIAGLIASHAATASNGGLATTETGSDAGDNGERHPAGADDTPGAPTGIACPECHGVLWAAADEEAPDFRCRVGHSYSDETLLEAHAAGLEAALWAGVRALEEQAALARHLGRKAQARGDRYSAARFQERAKTAGDHATQMEAVVRSKTAKSVSA